MALTEIQKQWVENLRSGKYTQGQQYLHTTNGEYCCLGVLCDMAVEAGVIGPPKKSSESTIYTESFDECYIYADFSYGLLPNEVRQWVGLSDDNGYFEVNKEGRSLVVLNDAGKSFAEIADLIESEPERLFTQPTPFGD